MTPREAFASQARACEMLGSPLTAAVCRTLGEHLAPGQGGVAEAVLGWQGDPSPAGASVPLRLAGGLHRLVLDGADADLASAYARGSVDWPTLAAALGRHEAALLDALTRPPQTNEVARAAAIVPAAHFALSRLAEPLPLEVMELGASAGLNLNWPRFRLDAGGGVTFGAADARVSLRPVWQGEPPEAARVEVASAEGVDLHPVADPEVLVAYAWADQAERIARLRAAIAEARRHPPAVAAGDAGDWLAERLARPPVPGRLRLVYHTIARQYFPPATEAAVQAALEDAGRDAGPDTPLAQFGMEGDGGTDGAALTLTLWTGGQARSWSLGRADFHGRWVRWMPREDA